MYLRTINKLFEESKRSQYQKYQDELVKKTKLLQEHMDQHLNDEEDVSIPAILETGYK